MTDKQFNALFRRRMDANARANDREMRSFASILCGYGSRAYHRFKTSSDKSGEIRGKLLEMAATGMALLREAVSRCILCEDILRTVSRLTYGPQNRFRWPPIFPVSDSSL